MPFSLYRLRALPIVGMVYSDKPCMKAYERVDSEAVSLGRNPNAQWKQDATAVSLGWAGSISRPRTTWTFPSTLHVDSGLENGLPTFEEEASLHVSSI
jgi:hypothetical protein